METYIAVMTMTAKGMDEIHLIPGFVKSFARNMEKNGGKFHGFWKTMGEIDYVCVFDAPDGNHALTGIMALGKTGYFSTTTLKAYSMDEMAASLERYSEKYT
ncbi:MAG: GYD domain-containing protein [Acidobacteriota bacterium]|jgi:uncharacterized protein with GYD domain|nr:GYD domain-containing protein [Acidobacteriota bacterium]